MRKRLTDKQRAQICARYTTPADDGTWVGSTTLAREFAVSPQTIQNVLRGAGIATRTARESHAGGKRCKPVTRVPPVDAAPPACKCGCGQHVAWNQRKDRWNAYVDGHYRPRRAYHDRSWLHREYVAARRSASDIAAEFGVSGSTIYKALAAAGIARRGTSEALIGVHAGDRNPAWRGGVTPDRQRLYRSAEWRALVTDVIRRDGGRCQRCGDGKRTALHTHHVVPWACDPTQRMNADNLVTLCPECHRWVHSRENVAQEFLA